jgi:cytidine deaminase
MNEWIENAFQAARETRARAHAPYSKFLVGAAVKPTGHDQLFSGCNVENASYGGTVCAERVALFNMVAAIGHQAIDFIVLITDTDPAAPPCGFCRQVMAEFAQTDFDVHLANLSGIQKTVHFSELLPFPFDESSLND